jgi:hypothetical protein
MIRECKNNEGYALFEAIAYYCKSANLNFRRATTSYLLNATMIAKILFRSDSETTNVLIWAFLSILMTDIGKLKNLLIGPAAKRLARATLNWLLRLHLDDTRDRCRAP